MCHMFAEKKNDKIPISKPSQQLGFTFDTHMEHGLHHRQCIQGGCDHSISALGCHPCQDCHGP